MAGGSRRGRQARHRTILKSVVFNADDFGAAVEVNEAIERGHRDGVLRSASLMVGAPACEDAVARARRLPTLAVGLHVVLVNGRPVLPPSAVPDLVDDRGEFLTDLVQAGMRFFFRPGIRRQLEAEMRAQFEAFAATGLPLDHVNAQCHMHVHPTIFGLLLNVGRDYGMGALRIPREPHGRTWSIEPWTGLMRARARARGIACNDYVYGVNDVGAMTESRVLQMLDALPDGVTELFFHPATAPFPGADPGTDRFQWLAELQALTSPAIQSRLTQNNIRSIVYGELPCHPEQPRSGGSKDA
ncbi:MAG TPA: hopanoid biosynthesis-associated protein HpnK [Candidatus Baltobacteraceae bacterium]|nr:hopanoid biosynthesis-associated protein HpnK [Candidatus Baltobacteraceae bacterium]